MGSSLGGTCKPFEYQNKGHTEATRGATKDGWTKTLLNLQTVEPDLS